MAEFSLLATSVPLKVHDPWSIDWLINWLTEVTRQQGFTRQEVQGVPISQQFPQRVTNVKQPFLPAVVLKLTWRETSREQPVSQKPISELP